MGNHSVDSEAPVEEAVGLMALEEIVGRRGCVGEGRLRDHAARELAGQGVRGENPLGGVGQCLAGTVDSTVIGRDESITPGEAAGHGETGEARSGGNAGGDESCGVRWVSCVLVHFFGCTAGSVRARP